LGDERTNFFRIRRLAVNKKHAAIVVASFVLLAATIARAAKRPLQVMPSVDLTRYAGKWYEIARLPNNFQKKCVGEVIANYTLKPDREIAVANRCREANGKIAEAKGTARRADKNKPNSILEVRFAPSFLAFLPFVWGDYQIIALGDAYSHAMVGTPDRKYLWILSRTPQLDEAIYGRLVAEAKEQGFEASRLQKTRQAGS